MIVLRETTMRHVILFCIIIFQMHIYKGSYFRPRIRVTFQTIEYQHNIINKPKL